MSTFDFGYPWWLSYGHLVILVPALAALVAGWRYGWGRGKMLVLGVVALWSVAALGVLWSVNINGRPALPTKNFFRSGAGRVLDIGAGTGRSTIMVLGARPQAEVVALDLFGESFSHHFGPGESPEERLRANLRAAGAEKRVTIAKADMQELPFGEASFDAIVSAYAVDHLPREGVKKALGEAARVIKPGGDFLLILVANDAWVKFAFGPVLTHGGTRGPGWWAERVKEAGFTTLEEGTAPATRYLLLRR